MFSIGLFSAYLPYIMIAIFSGAYLGIHSIVRAELQGNPAEAGITVRKVHSSNTCYKSSQEKRTFYYDQFTEQSETGPAIPKYAVPGTIYTGTEIAVPRSWCCASLYCRPPPRV